MLFNNEKQSSAGIDQNTLIIGATLPLTGDLAFIGTDIKRAMELSVAELGVEGKDIQLVFEDDSFDPIRAVSATNKLINSDNIDVLVSFGSPVGNAVSPVADRNQIAHINVGASDPNVAKGRYNYVHWTPPQTEVEKLYEKFNRKGIRDIAVIEINQPGILAVSNAMRDLSDNYGISINSEFKANPGESDFRTQINNLDKSADYLVVLATSPELEIIAGQLQEAGNTIPVTGIESFEWTSQPELFEGTWYVNASEATDEFITTFSAQHGSNPNVGAANAYDIPRMLVGIASDEEINAENIATQLESLQSFASAVGELSVMSDGRIVTEAVVRHIVNGKPQTIE